MFNIIDSAVASQSRVSSSKYVEALGGLAISTKNADGSFTGAAIEVEKEGQVLSFREAAKRLGLGLVTRKQSDGKTRVWKVSKTDLPARKAHKKSKAKA